MNRHILELSELIEGIYLELDHSIQSFKDLVEIRCLTGCGSCCHRSEEVEATLLECIPLALSLYRQGIEEEFLEKINRAALKGDVGCVLYNPTGDQPEQGSCAQYAGRPLLCRLFGVAARKDKRGASQLSLCNLIRQEQPDEALRAEKALADGILLPHFQDYFHRIASLYPGHGYRLIPINRAIEEALAYIYWRRPPRDLDGAKAS